MSTTNGATGPAPTSSNNITNTEKETLSKLIEEWLKLKDHINTTQKNNSELLKPQKDREKELKEEILRMMEDHDLKKIMMQDKLIQLVSKTAPVKPKQEEIMERLVDFVGSQKKAKKIWKHIYETNREVKTTSGLRVKTSGGSGGKQEKNDVEDQEGEDEPVVGQKRKRSDNDDDDGDENPSKVAAHE